MTFEMEHDGHTLEIDHDRDWGMEILGIKCPHKAQLEAIKRVVKDVADGEMSPYDGIPLERIKEILKSSELS